MPHITYKCDGCYFCNTDKQKVIEHEKTCEDVIQNKTCTTCGNIETVNIMNEDEVKCIGWICKAQSNKDITNLAPLFNCKFYTQRKN